MVFYINRWWNHSCEHLKRNEVQTVNRKMQITTEAMNLAGQDRKALKMIFSNILPLDDRSIDQFLLCE